MISVALVARRLAGSGGQFSENNSHYRSVGKGEEGEKKSSEASHVLLRM